MVTMFRLVQVLLAITSSSAFTPLRYNFERFWIKGHSDAEIQEYRQHGRSCGDCHFPFLHQDELIYGCIQNRDLEYVCKNSNGTFIECNNVCPLGNAEFLGILPFSSPNGESVILECHGAGSPNPTITWRKDGEVIDVVESPVDAYPKRTRASITLKYEEEDYGLYSCEVENGHSNDTSGVEGRLFYENYSFTANTCLPLPPTNFRIVSVIRTYVTLEWDFEELVSNYQRRYELSITPGLLLNTNEFSISAYEKSIKIKHLQPGELYEFKVRRVTPVGHGLYSEPAYAAIPQNAPIDRPVNVTIEKVGPYSVSLRWKVTGDYDRYQESQIYFNQGLYSDEDNSTLPFYGHSKDVIGLSPNTKYRFEVEAIFLSNIKRRADPVYATTLPLAPSIKHLEASDNGHNEVVIECKAEGVPIPDIKWLENKELLPSTIPLNTSISSTGLTSIITLLRTPFIYSEYACIANNSAGTARQTFTVPYNGTQPTVALAQMIMKLADNIEEIKNELKSMRQGVCDKQTLD